MSPTGWNSFDDQNLDPAGPLPEQNWTEGGGSDANKLVEACLLCQTEFAQGGSHTLGQAFNTSVGGQDLEFYYAGPSGQLLFVESLSMSLQWSTAISTTISRAT